MRQFICWILLILFAKFCPSTEAELELLKAMSKYRERVEKEE